MLNQLLLLNALQSLRPQRKSTADPASLLILASLLSQHKKKPPLDPERNRLRAMTLRAFCRECYWPGKNHSPTGPTAELSTDTLNRLRDCFGRELAVGELKYGALRAFRQWLGEKIAAGMSPATANRHLRQLRAIWNFAARPRWTNEGLRWRPTKPPPPMEFFREPETDVDAWTPDQLALIESRARSLTGMVGNVPARVFWPAWALVQQKIGCRITAMMLTRRGDYDSAAKALLLRRENQKQKKDQRIALPARTAAAIEELLAAHDGELIFGCWPFDPPNRSTGRHHWPVLSSHFERLLVTPIGLKLEKGVKTRQFRRSAATIVEENGGNAQELLGHANRKTTERYKDRKRGPICRQSLLIPDGAPAQRMLF